MSNEDRQVIREVNRNRIRREWADEIELERSLMEAADRARMRQDRRRTHYRTVMPVSFFGAGMMVVVGVWLFWRFQSTIALSLLWALGGILVGYGFHFDNQSRK